VDTLQTKELILKADIKYTVKYHATTVKKIAKVFLAFGALIIVLLDFIWTPFQGLTPELQTLAILYILPSIFWDLNLIAILCLGLGYGLWLLRWRSGKIELAEDKLIIYGSYYVSIWLKNMWEVDIQDIEYERWRIKLDSNVDAVQIKFKTEKEFEDFSEALIKLVGEVENIKFKTTV
jgi:hypothetical protein